MYISQQPSRPTSEMLVPSIAIFFPFFLRFPCIGHFLGMSLSGFVWICLNTETVVPNLSEFAEES
jgi:hypothetical protein